MFSFIERQNGRKISIERMCRICKVSESGYYKWKKSSNSPKSWQLLLVKIHQILDEHPDNHNYGISRIHLALQQRGEKASRSTVIRAMRRGNLLHKNRRSPSGLTKADKKAQRVQNVIKQCFTAKKPNEKWLTDITQVSCCDGKLYIVPIFDCFNGEIVSIAMDNNMKKELCIRSVKEAYRTTKARSGVIIHSDAGSQYTSDLYKKTLASFRAIQSMSDVGKCYDNSRMESFFATLKKEKLHRLKTHKMKMEAVKTEVWRYVMIYYNRQRISTVNQGGLPPVMLRRQAGEKQATA